jgi:hypothetical protein
MPHTQHNSRSYFSLFLTGTLLFAVLFFTGYTTLAKLGSVPGGHGICKPFKSFKANSERSDSEECFENEMDLFMDTSCGIDTYHFKYLQINRQIVPSVTIVLFDIQKPPPKHVA